MIRQLQEQQGFIEKRIDEINESPLEERALLREIEHGVEIGIGTSANVFSISDRYIVKAIDRTRTFLEINALEEEFRIQEEAHSTIGTHQNEFPNIRIPQPIAMQKGKQDENGISNKDYIVMEKIDGIALHHKIIIETLKNTKKGQEIFLFAIRNDRRLQHIAKPESLNEQEAWGVIQEYHPQYTQFAEQRKIDEYSGKKNLRDPRAQMFEFLISEINKLGNGKNVPSLITFGDSQNTINQQHTEQLKRAILRLHQNGIVHRDLGPWNILLGKDGNIYIIDFGIAFRKEHKQSQYRSLSTAELDEAYIIERGDEKFGDIHYVRDEDIINVFHNIESISSKQQYSQELIEQYHLNPDRSIIRKRLKDEFLAQTISQLGKLASEAQEQEQNLDYALRTLEKSSANAKIRNFTKIFSDRSSTLYLEALLVMIQIDPTSATAILELELKHKPTQMTLQRHQEIQKLLQELTIDNQ